MDKKYLVVLDARHPKTHFLAVETDDFREVDVVVNRWMWGFSDGQIYVYKRADGDEKVIKHLILKK